MCCKFSYKEEAPLEKLFQIRNCQRNYSCWRAGIEEKISFDELREKLPSWRMSALKSLIFDVMAEKNMKTVAFPGLLKRPRLTRKPIPVGEDGNLPIQELLAEKGFLGRKCFAYAHVGDRKITLTSKPGNDPESRDPEIYG